MTAFLNPWVILSLVLAIAGAFGGGYYKGNSVGQAEVQQKWDKEKTEQYAAYAEAQETARAREQNLQVQADRLREDKDREIRNLNARATALSNSLRERPSRPTAEASAVPNTAEVGPVAAGCTGKELYRADGEFLAREAARGDETRLLLKQCREQYETVMKQFMDWGVATPKN
jgi:hypothetical protein